MGRMDVRGVRAGRVERNDRGTAGVPCKVVGVVARWLALCCSLGEGQRVAGALRGGVDLAELGVRERSMTVRGLVDVSPAKGERLLGRLIARGRTPAGDEHREIAAGVHAENMLGRGARHDELTCPKWADGEAKTAKWALRASHKPRQGRRPDP